MLETAFKKFQRKARRQGDERTRALLNPSAISQHQPALYAAVAIRMSSMACEASGTAFRTSSGAFHEILREKKIDREGMGGGSGDDTPDGTPQPAQERMGRPPRWRQTPSSTWSSAHRSASPLRAPGSPCGERRVCSDGAGGRDRLGRKQAMALSPCSHVQSTSDAAPSEPGDAAGRSRSGSRGGTGSEIAGGAAHGFMPLGARRSLDSDDPLPELGIPELNDGEERVCCGMVDLTDNSRNRCPAGTTLPRQNATRTTTLSIPARAVGTHLTAILAALGDYDKNVITWVRGNFLGPPLSHSSGRATSAAGACGSYRHRYSCTCNHFVCPIARAYTSRK